MKKIRNMLRRILVVSVSAVLTASSIPVSAASEFSSVPEQPAVEETFPVLEDVFGDTQQEPENTAPILEDAFTSGEEKAEFESEEIPAAGEVTGELDYIKGRPLTEEEKEEQLAPFENLEPIGDIPSVDSDLGVDIIYGRAASYPSKYDARNLGIITEAKNQEPFGICWAFGMASMMETSLLSQGKGAYDLSEEHLAYFFSHRVNDPLGNTPDDINIHLDDYHQGGNDYLASVFLSTWSGMTTEAEVPLPTDASHVQDMTVTVDPSKAYNAAAYLTNASFSDYSVERMKQMLMERNSVSIMYYMDNKFYNPNTAAASYPYKTGVNHVVVVVGWDDNYSKNNFPAASGVTSDGAWIVKNSWGRNWGKDGYFYLSYEDKNISSLVSADAADSVEYSNNYFYDGSSGLQTISLKTGRALANIFRASAGNGKEEILGEVNVATFSDNAQYSVQVYTNLRDASDPVSGTPAYDEPIEVHQPLAGVHTIEVPEVSIVQNTLYSVVITNTGSRTFKFCCEADASYGNWFRCSAGIKKGQGFGYDLATGAQWAGKWADMYDISATPRIKAHTRTENAPVQLTMSFKAAKTSLHAGEKISTEALIMPGSPAEPAFTYTSSDKNVATVSSSGVVTAVSAGTAVITCKSKDSADLTASVTVNVSLAKPSFNVKAYSSGYNKVSWSKVPGAGGYRIYRKIPGKSWSLVAKAGASATFWQDKKAAALQSYQYTVRAYKTYKDQTYLSQYSAGDVIKTSPVTQKISSVSSVSSGIKVRWSPQKKCDGYRIYRKEKGGSWKTVKTLSKGSYSSYTDKTAKKGKTYYYAVRAYVNEPYGRLYGAYKASKAVTRK